MACARHTRDAPDGRRRPGRERRRVLLVYVLRAAHAIKHRRGGGTPEETPRTITSSSGMLRNGMASTRSAATTRRGRSSLRGNGMLAEGSPGTVCEPGATASGHEPQQMTEDPGAARRLGPRSAPRPEPEASRAAVVARPRLPNRGRARGDAGHIATTPATRARWRSRPASSSSPLGLSGARPAAPRGRSSTPPHKQRPRGGTRRRGTWPPSWPCVRRPSRRRPSRGCTCRRSAAAPRRGRRLCPSSARARARARALRHAAARG